MRTRLWIIPVMGLLILSSCTYRHYLGMHGPSVRNFPDIHQGMTNDAVCLECHHPGKNTSAPATSHAGFSGCLKCHNDPN